MDLKSEGGFTKGLYSNTIFLDPDTVVEIQVPLLKCWKISTCDFTVSFCTGLEELDCQFLVIWYWRWFVTERPRMVNKTNSDIFISIHFNATGNTKSDGIQTYSYSDEPDYPSIRLINTAQSPWSYEERANAPRRCHPLLSSSRNRSQGMLACWRAAKCCTTRNCQTSRSPRAWIHG